MEILIGILGGSVGAAVATGIFSLIKWKLDRKATVEDREDDKFAAECRSRGEELSKVEKRVDGLYVAMRLQMYNDIKMRAKAAITHGGITSEELEDIIKMHNCYHDDLGGNGYLDTLMKQVKQLRIVGE